MNPYAILIAAALGFGSGLYVRGNYEDAARLDEIKDVKGRLDAEKAKVSQLEDELVAARAVQAPKDRIITREVVRYETVVPAYRRCELDGAWRLLHDAAATGEPAESAELSAGNASPVTDAAALETVAENYESCRNLIAIVRGWQSYWNTVKGHQEKPQ